MTDRDKTKKTKISPKALAKEMFEAGVHFGHKKTNWHPKMRPFIYGTRNNVYIIDLEKTIEYLDKALNFVKETVKNKEKILFVGTRPQSQSLIEELGKKTNMPYIIFRWVGGLLTNFKNIRKRVEHLIDLEDKKKAGEFKKYTKKEQLEIDKEIEKLKKKFEGIKNLEKLPKAIFVLSMEEQETAIKEACKKKVSIISLVDTNNDPSLVDYPIPSNNDAVSALKFMIEKVEKAILKIKQ